MTAPGEEKVAVGVVGSGTMGAGIAEVAALAGHRVVLTDAVAGRAEATVGQLRQRWRAQVDRGKLSQGVLEDALHRLKPDDDLTALSGSGLVVEAVVEDLAVKRELFAQLEQVVTDEALLATNTSSLSVTALGAALRIPGRFAGLHFFNPVPRMPLVEVVTGLGTDPVTASRLYELVLGWGKVPVRCASTPGFIVNRVARPFYGEAFRALAEGVAEAATLDALVREGGGFKMGPLELSDLIGQDVNAAANRAVWSAFGQDPWFRPSVVQDELVAGGRLGRKTGSGVFDEAAGTAQPKPVAGKAGETLRVATKVRHAAVLSILSQLREAGIEPAGDELLPSDVLAVGAAAVAVTDGRAALARCRELGAEELLLIDVVPGVQNRRRVGVATSAGRETDAVRALAGQLQRAGIVTHYCADVPGLILTRTVAMLVNLAVEAVAAGVATAADVGLAMRMGVNYPRDLFEWGDEIGAGRLVEFLDHLEDEHRDGHFRPCAALRRLHRAGAGIVTGLTATKTT